MYSLSRTLGITRFITMVMLALSATATPTPTPVLPDEMPTASLQIQARTIALVDWSSDASLLAITRYDRTLEVIEASTNKSLFSYGPLDLGMRSVLWSPTDRNKLAIESGLGIVIFLDFSTTPETGVFTDGVTAVDAITWSPDGTKLAGAVEERPLVLEQPVIRIWDTTTGKVIDKYQIHNELLRELDWSPDSALLAGGTADGIVTIWDAMTGSQVMVLDAPERFEDGYSFVDDLSWSPDSHLLVTASNSGSPPQSDLGFWDIRSGKLLAHYPKDFINSIEWSPVGNLVAFTEGYTVQVIEAISGDTLAEFQNPVKIKAVAWSPDGSQLAYGGADGTLHIVPAPIVETPTPLPTATITPTP